MVKGTALAVILILFSITQYAEAQVVSAQAVSGEYIVKYKSSTSLSAGLKVSGKISAGVSVKTVFSRMQMMHVKLADGASLSQFSSDPNVEYIEPNYILTIDPVMDMGALGVAPSPSDTYTQSGSNVQVRQSWDIQKPYDQGSKVVVAVIDTGLNRNHLLFKDSGAIWENTAEKNGTPGVDDDSNGLIDDINGWNYIADNGNVDDDNDHGTHCAGIVLGVGQDVFAMPVRESKVQIMTLKFLDSSGSGTTADAVSAINYAVAKGAKVINNSWGGSAFAQSLQDAYNYAYTQNVTIVSAAGNANTNNDSVSMYPANINTPGNISVMASTDADNKATFSNFGATKVHVGAPGVNIVSSLSTTGCADPGCFAAMSGTSMAAPFVAGLAALILREAPQLSPYQVKNIVTGTIDASSGLSGRNLVGGRVNAFKAITEAINQINTPASLPASDSSSRSPASAQSSGATPAGCGLVKAVVDSAGPPSAPPVVQMFSVLMLFLPLMIAINLRRNYRFVG